MNEEGDYLQIEGHALLIEVDRSENEQFYTNHVRGH